MGDYFIPGRFDDRVVLVTGGGQGIGEGAARRMAREGAAVAVADLQGNKAEAVAKEIEAAGGKAAAFTVNVATVADIENLVHGVVGRFGRIDVLVHSAGIVQSKGYLDTTEADWNRVIDINQRGTAFCVQRVAQQMIRQLPAGEAELEAPRRSNGKIVNLSSISGRRGRSYQLAYAASKAAVISITQSAALAFARYGINVNAVCPSVVYTPMWEQNIQDKVRAFGVDAKKESDDFVARIPLKRAGTVEEMAAAICFLCSSDADYITGQSLNVDGGFEMN